MDQSSCLLNPDRPTTSHATTTGSSTITEKITTVYDELLGQLNNQTVVLTPNRRLAVSLLQRYHAIQASNGSTCWENPTILPITAWIKRIWDSTLSSAPEQSPLLLNAAQELNVWETILETMSHHDAMLQISETAEIAQSAWRLLKQWDIALSHPSLTSNIDYASMQAWATRFSQRCEQEQWIDEASLPARLTALLLDKQINLPRHIMLVGFTDVPPATKQFFQACEKHACSIQHFKPSQQTKNMMRTSWEDKDSELYAIARWAKSHLVSNESTSLSPQIGCVIPGLDQIRDHVDHIFMTVFGEDSNGTLYNLSAGKPLSHYPVIQAAFALLSLSGYSISVDQFYHVLSMPFIGEAELEYAQRARLDSVLRQRNQIQITIDDALIEHYCPRLAERLTTFNKLLLLIPSQVTHDVIADHIALLLKTLGWPGERSLDSHEYQLVNRWMELLHEFCQLDLVNSTTNLQTAIKQLKQIADHTLYQTQTPHTPIQIVGLLEAAGLTFDYLWIAGMDDTNWPPAPKPNPLLPKSLQREHTMPHATAERELHFCKRIMEQFAETANIIIYSYARKSDDIERHVSPLIRDLHEVNENYFNLFPFTPTWLTLFSSKRLEYVNDEMGPPIIDGMTISGGVNLIRNQARCPFKAFAEHRLHARALEEPVPGWRAYERGNRIHTIMEYIWKKLGNQASLIQLNDDTLQTLVDEAILFALDSKSNSRKYLKRYNLLEHQRLKRLIIQWLLLEKTRQPFQVEAIEKSTQIQVGPLHLDCKIDRIDLLENQTRIIIDYKTGANHGMSNWFGDRPDEPQLPLYAISEEAVTAIVYGQINAVDMALYGISRDDQNEQDIKVISTVKCAEERNWNEQLEYWRTVLTQLGLSFCQGHAELDPKSSDTCEHCHLQTFCRIQEEIPNDEST